MIGWLLACRQAYAEGIDVLYSTNTFFLESTTLFDALFCPASHRAAQQLLLPHHLASITSLELRWELLLWGQINHWRGNPWTSDPLTSLFADKGRATRRLPPLPRRSVSKPTFLGISLYGLSLP